VSPWAEDRGAASPKGQTAGSDASATAEHPPATVVETPGFSAVESIDAEILNMAAFKLRECSARLRALSARARSETARVQFAGIAAALDLHAYHLASDTSSDAETAGASGHGSRIG
jgi:hypothetical protein